MESEKNVAPRKNVRECIFLLLTLLWCTLIFCFSAQNADESSQTSEGVIGLFCTAVSSIFGQLDNAERAQLISDMQFIVRKAAHFTLYLILSVFALQFFLSGKRLKRSLSKYAAAWGFCIFYAMTDEFHQRFVPGRSSEIRDVCIDSLGALTGLLLSLAVILIIRRSKKEDS